MIKENIDGTFASESVNLCQTKCEIALDLWKLPQMHRYNLKILRQEISTRFSLKCHPFPFPFTPTFSSLMRLLKVRLQRQLL